MADKPKLVSAAELAAKPVREPDPKYSKAPDDAEYQALVAERKETRPGPVGGRPAKTPTRDLLLQRTYKDIERLQPVVMQRMLEALSDKNDPLHERAFDIAAKRTIPIAFVEGLSKQEFRPDEEQNRVPQIVINVTGGAGATASVQSAQEVVDVEAREVEE